MLKAGDLCTKAGEWETREKSESLLPKVGEFCISGYITWHVQTLEKTEHNFPGTKKIIREMRKRKRKKKKMMIWRMMALDTVSEIYSNIMFSQSGPPVIFRN